MRIIVCGGRDYVDEDHIFSVLDDFKKAYPDLEIISGMARGADSIAVLWAANRGVKLHKVYADWDKHKKAAGFIRNKRMLDMNPDKVVAFAGGSGTNHMMMIARKAKVEVYEF